MLGDINFILVNINCLSKCFNLLRHYYFIILYQILILVLMKKKIEKLQFIFPESVAQLEIASSLEQLKQILQQKMYDQNIDKEHLRYKFSIKKNKYLYITCRCNQCSAHLRYRLDENGHYKLTNFFSNHSHPFPNAKKQRFSGASSFIQSLPLTIPSCSLKAIACKQFGLTDKQFYYLVKKTRAQEKTIDHLISDLQAKGYQFFLSGQNRQCDQPPQILLAFDPIMKKKYSRYKDVISFDLTFNLVKNLHPSGHKWKIGCFLGISSSKHIVPLGLVATLYETKEAYMQIFQTFFHVMQDQPNVIVTDEEKAIHSALVQLEKRGQFNGIHLYDSFHILHNVKKKLKIKQNIRYFKNLLHAKHAVEFEQNLENAERNLHSQQLPILQRFCSISKFYCFSKIPPVFFGFTATSSLNQSLHNLLKRIQPSEKSYSITLMNMLKYLQYLQLKTEEIEIETIPYENYFQLPQIKVLRLTLSRSVFSKFIQELGNSLRCEIMQGNISSFLVKEKNGLFKLFREQNCWSCQCQYMKKCGLICRHLLRFLIIKSISIIDYLPNRWKIGEFNTEQSKRPQFRMIPLGREKLSRRNLQR